MIIMATKEVKPLVTNVSLGALRFTSACPLFFGLFFEAVVRTFFYVGILFLCRNPLLCQNVVTKCVFWYQCPASFKWVDTYLVLYRLFFLTSGHLHFLVTYSACCCHCLVSVKSIIFLY